VKITNHTNGLNNELQVFDACPNCGLEVDGLRVDYGMPDLYGDEPARPWISTNGITMLPCGCLIPMSDADRYCVYRFPKTPEGKAGYNAQVHRKAVEAVRAAPPGTDRWGVPI